MKELKFRAWHEADKCWYNPRFIEMNLLGQAILSHGIEQFEIIPASAIEQYTGLKDKNGREIYEGDIVNITAIVNTDDSDMACIIDTNSIVCWDKEHARWDVNDKPEDEDWDYRRRRYFVFVNSESREDVEVIGNIHENPELLGDEDD